MSLLPDALHNRRFDVKLRKWLSNGVRFRESPQEGEEAMNVLDLDEAQGLTREMVDRYLDRAGWCHMPDPEQRLLKPQYVHVSFKMGLGAAVERIASITGSAPQALLREINPRMRKGMPSQAAREAHPLSLWLAMPDFECIGAVVSIVVSLPPDDDDFGMWHPEGFCFADTKPKRPDLWMFWPCDEHGNKTRWPEKDGVML